MENRDLVHKFNSSILTDCRLYREDIAVSMAHAEMLGECGIITKADSVRIIAGLEEIRWEIENGQLQVDFRAEDIHMFIETELTRRIGDAGKMLHTARSRNDQVATDMKMWLICEADEIKSLLTELITALKNHIKVHQRTIMPGYTHLQRAQPITFANHIGAYVQMFERDLMRVEKVKFDLEFNCPLGSGALAGTTYPIDREMTAKSLGFRCSSRNTIDGVSDRDFCIEVASALAIIMMHLSRFSEEIIMWSSMEFRFIEIDNAFATGSSIMPQKKNPDVAELVRGKAARVFSDLQTLLVLLKGLPLAYNKDMQEDKDAVFDAVDTVKECLTVFIPMISTITVNVENMRRAAAQGFLNATDCADYLVKKGMPFRDAYRLVKEIVKRCAAKGVDLENLPLQSYKAFSPLFDEDVFEAVNLENCVFWRNIEHD